MMNVNYSLNQSLTPPPPTFHDKIISTQDRIIKYSNNNSNNDDCVDATNSLNINDMIKTNKKTLKT